MASSALAAAPSADNPAGRELLGVVPAHGNAVKGAGGGSNLAYHGGPVVRGDRTYAIYWQPPGFTTSASYSSVIDGFFGNVASANSSGWQASTYFSDTQYTDAVGPAGFTGSSWGGSFTDNSPYPASGCKDTVAQTAVCLSDAQLRSEITKVIAGNALPTDGKTIYFIFTPKNVGSCSGSTCAFSYYCAYHSSYALSTGTVLYANQPYTNTVPSACGTGEGPNDADADSTLNVASHEHNETITDPLGNAWYDRRGYENADKCAWTFGTALGGATGTHYNQAIGSGQYYLQQNWSNKRSGCVLTGQ